MYLQLFYKKKKLKIKDVLDIEIPKFNELVAEANVPAVILQKEELKK